jgi:hypothetical protein
LFAPKNASVTGGKGAAMLPPGWAAFSNPGSQNTKTGGQTPATNGFYWPWHGGWNDHNYVGTANWHESPSYTASSEREAELEAQEQNYTPDALQVDDDFVVPEPPPNTRRDVRSTNFIYSPDLSIPLPGSRDAVVASETDVNPIKLSDDEDGSANIGVAASRSRDESSSEPPIVPDNPSLDNEGLGEDADKPQPKDEQGGFVAKVVKFLMSAKDFEERVENSDADSTYGKLADAAEQVFQEKAKEGVVEGAEQELTKISPEAAIFHKMTGAIFNTFMNPLNLVKNAKEVVDTGKTIALDPMERQMSDSLNAGADNR